MQMSFWWISWDSSELWNEYDKQNRNSALAKAYRK